MAAQGRGQRKLQSQQTPLKARSLAVSGFAGNLAWAVVIGFETFVARNHSTLSLVSRIGAPAALVPLR
ncbi:hypothetical protein CDL15_Pgr010229 [Punica granatum]|uniref:Uncharacterized protein n=1 Tax=Punica granatum TaxID=22663 RepID=A0A218XQE8_PUNGR|nr:hypothetical protein CDL15_Pgr010229 [Punica granatum]